MRGYRPDIDGLRALAILAVVAFHASPVRFRGGFAGVDVFFVISGFLISGILLDALCQDRFSFRAFYASRIRRIFPALITVLAAAFILGWFVLLPDEFAQLGRHMAASAGFVQNFVLLKESGYFDTLSEAKPLLHLWSLAIEEQFYILYPVILWGAWKLRLNLLSVLVCLFLLSFCANVTGIEKDVVKVFYRPQTRFWELLAGCILAYLHLFHRQKMLAGLTALLRQSERFRAGDMPPARVENLLSGAGLCLLIFATFTLRRENPFPGWWALIPVAGSLCLILAGPDAWINRHILAHKGMVFIGRISYPLYLWHWLLLSLARVLEGALPPRRVRIGLVLLSFALAWLTCRWIEAPIRFGRRARWKIMLLVLGILLVGALGLHVARQNGFPARTQAFENITRVIGEWEYPGLLEAREERGIPVHVRTANPAAVTLFVGDSNVAQYAARVEALIRQHPETARSAIFLVRYGCLPGADPAIYDAKTRPNCGSYLTDAVMLARADPRIRTVVIAGIWNYYIDLEMQADFPNQNNIVKKLSPESAEYRAALERLARHLGELVQMKKEVYLVLNIPIGKAIDPRYMTRRSLRNFPDVFRIDAKGISRAELEQKYGASQAEIARIAQEAGAKVIDPLEFLCNPESCAPLDAAGNPMYESGIHLAPSFARHHVFYLDQTVLEY